MRDDFLSVVCDGIGDCYKDLTRSVYDEGDIVVSRGLETKEIRPFVLILNKPQERFLMCPGRKANIFFQVLESIWILGGRGDLEFISYYLKNMQAYADNKEEFHAPYGIRMRHVGKHREMYYDSYGFHDQLKHCYEYLKKDPDTRHAVMSFWDPVFDNYQVKTNDRPCNIAFHLLIRDGKLDFTIFNRSNDLHWGLANTNVVQFSVILEAMGMLLSIPVGNQIHISNSLHYYTDSLLTKSVLDAEYEFNPYEHIEPLPFEMEFKTEDRLADLDEELELFFKLEDKIRKGTDEESDIDLSFNFLQIALILSRSFKAYKEENYRKAYSYIERIEADDIFVSATEFLVRKITEDLLRDEISVTVKARFQKLLDEEIKQIIHFIFNH